jgi:preprotein translocase subunit SecE
MPQALIVLLTVAFAVVCIWVLDGGVEKLLLRRRR